MENNNSITSFLKELHTVTGNIENYFQKSEYWPFLKGMRSEATNDITLLTNQQKTQIINRINDISERLDKATPLIRNHHKKAHENLFSFDEFSEQVFGLFTGTPEPPKNDLLHYLHCWHDAIMIKKTELKLFVNDVKKVFPEAEIRKPDPEKQSNRTGLKEIALKYIYQGNQITRENGNEIAQKHGWKSGEKLFQYYSYFSSKSNRTGRPEPCTPKKLKNKIELLENTIKILPEKQRQRAIDEANILKTIYENEYL